VSYQLVILKKLEKGPMYANTPGRVARWLDIDVSRETAVCEVNLAMTTLLEAGHVDKTQEPDELNCDPRMSSGATVDVYWLTDSGRKHLAAQLAEASA
jgi:hypothetical protein